jgi:hypothetical protein
MKSLLFLILLFIELNNCFAHKVKGTIRDEKGALLSFASVYLEGTSKGTTSNIDGIYSIDLAPGDHQLVFQYIGYTTQVITIQINQQDTVMDVILLPLSNNLEEIVVKASDDPAYRIIKKTIKKRKFHLDQLNNYTCDSYVKGSQSITNLPKSIMGQSLSRIRKGLDSSGTGIVYLSESISKLYVKDGQFKEIMSSSKLSGNDNGFSFNSGASMAEMSFYKNSFEIENRKILSPIAAGALAYYRYRLDNSFYDKNGHLIFKIEVIPKNKSGAVFAGYLYIVDDFWSIHSTDLYTTGKSINISILDTVRFKQTHLYLGDNQWRLFSQEVDFSLKLLAIKTAGNFIGVFSNYSPQATASSKLLTAELFKVADNANKKSTPYWDSIRPVPLTIKEKEEYRTKDSLQQIWKGKDYLDSIDRLANRPKIFDLLGGYTYQNSFKKFQFSILSPANNLHFNTVQGQIIGLGFEWKQSINADKRSSYSLHMDGEYSFGDRQFRGNIYGLIKFNAINKARLKIEAGRYKKQFNPDNPIPLLVNTYYSLLGKLNYAKFYDDLRVKLSYAQILFNGFYLRSSLHIGRRSALVNSTDSNWFPKNTNDYFSNHPLDINRGPFKDAPLFKTHFNLEFELALRIRFGQKYISYPNRRFYTPSKFPDLWIKYRRGIPLLGAVTDYDYLEISLEKEDIPLGTAGLFSFRAQAGWFPYKKKLYFIDYRHFNGNHTILAKTSEYLNTFQLLPYYEYSTASGFVQVHLEHDFNGFIWNKIPGLKVLGFEFVSGYHLLYTPEKDPYMEFNVGIDRIGWNLFRILRVDFVMAYNVGKPLRLGGVLGVTISL